MLDMSSEPVLKVQDLVKDYGKFRAVDGISFEIPKGKVVGFLGPNGAGKTTTIQILLGLTTKTEGSIYFLGKDFYSHKQYCLQRMNHISAFNTLLGKITVFENLVVFAHLYDMVHADRKIYELLEYFEIRDLANTQYQHISSGQKTRVNIVKSLLNAPKLILMDEPTASLDPDIADKTLSLIEKLRNERNLSILYTSHNMEEITRVCDEVIFVQNGKIVAHDTPLGLTKRIPNVTLKLIFNSGKETIHEYITGHAYRGTFHDEHTISIEATEKQIPRIIFDLSKLGIWITDIEVRKPTLEDVFLQIARQ